MMIMVSIIFFSDVLDFYSYTIFRDESNGKVSSLSYEPYGYKFIDEVNDMSYELDRNLHILKVPKGVQYDDVDENKVRKAVFEFMDPLLARRNFPGPLINLQWLFNLRYMNSYECVKKCS